MIAFQLAIDTRIDFLNERFAFTVKTTASFVSGNVYAYCRTLRFGKQRESAKDDEDGVIQRIYCSL